MVNAILWYATAPGQTAASVPSARKIIFDSTGNKSFAPLKLIYTNNIKQTPNPQNAGVRQINVTENGLKDANYPVGGFIKISDSDSDKLYDFPVTQQVTDALPFGRFGIEYPNLPKLSFVPSAIKGLSIGHIELTHNSTNKSLEFAYTMLFGGTFT